ncbi:MAG TPA: COX15/CtaA family protein [Dehalococcoidia bacterium]
MSQTTGFQRLCILACVVIFGLIVLGGIVRATDSGLGCPDWPTCHGSVIPRWEKHTLIEYSHRLTASIAGFLVLGIAVWAWRSYRRVPAILYPSLLVLGLIIVQAGLGGAAVLNDLPPEIVAVHLGMALTILTLLALVTMTSFAIDHPTERPAASLSVRRVALLAAAGTLCLALVGSYVSGAGYGLACSGWPLCNNELVPSADSASVQVHFLHRFLALIVGLTLVALAWLARRERRRAPLIATFAFTALGVYCVQALIGAANVWTDLADEVTAAHLAFATLLWLTLAVLNIEVHRIYEWLPRTSGQPHRTDLAAGATR